MAVIVDAVLGFQFLDVGEIRFCVRAGDAVAEGLVGVEEDFFEDDFFEEDFLDDFFDAAIRCLLFIRVGFGGRYFE